MMKWRDAVEKLSYPPTDAEACAVAVGRWLGGGLMTDDLDDRVAGVLYAGALVRRWRELLGEESVRFPDEPLLRRGWGVGELLDAAFEEARLAGSEMRMGNTVGAAECLRYVEACFRVIWKSKQPPSWDAACGEHTVSPESDHAVNALATLADVLMFAKLPTDQSATQVAWAGAQIRAWRETLPVIDDTVVSLSLRGDDLLFYAVEQIAAARRATSNGELVMRLHDAETALRVWWEAAI